ncbi:MAG: hypothetical protein R6U17_08645 [Thermoplasmata archaeon]
MTDKYLKAGKLAREMEKKAKKTADKKRETSKDLEKVEELLNHLRDAGGDVDRVEEIIREARELLDDNDIDEASQTVKKGMDMLLETAEERIEGIVDETELIHVFIAKEDMYEYSLKKLDKAEELLEMGEVKESLKNADKALDLAKQSIRQKLRNDLIKLDSAALLLEGEEEDGDKIESIIQGARVAMEEEDFSTAVSLVSECRDILYKELEEMLEREIEKVTKLEKAMSEEGASTLDIEELTSKVETQIEQKDFESAVGLVEDAKKELNEVLEDAVKKRESELKKSIEEAEEIECNVWDIKEKREEIEDFKRKGNFSEAYSCIEECLEELDELKLERVLNTIAKSKNHFVRGKEIGIDISEPMELLNRARDSLKREDYKGALDWAHAGMERVRDLVEEYERFGMRIAEAKRVYGGLLDINIEMPEALEMIAESQEALKEKNDELAEEKLKEFDEYVDRKAYPEVMKLVEDLEAHVNVAEDMGLDTAECLDRLEVAIANTKSGEHAKAGRIALNAKEELESQIKEEMDQRIDNLKQVAEKVQEDEEESVEEMETIGDILEELENVFEHGRYPEAWELLQHASDDVRKWRVGEAEERFSQVKELTAMIEDMDIKYINVDMCKKDLEEISEAFWSNDFVKVICLSEEMIDGLSGYLKDTAEDLFLQAKRETVKAKREGVDIEHIKERLKRCQEYIQDKNYAAVIKYSSKIEEEAKRITEKRKSSYELVSDLSSHLAQLKKEGKLEDVAPVKELLLKAQNCFMDEDYIQAESLAIQAEEKINELVDKNELVSKLREYREGMEYALSLDIDISDIEETIDVNSIMREGDLDKGLEKIEDAQELLDERVFEHLEPEIQRTREIIEYAEDRGINISQQKKILEKAEEMWDRGDFKGALRHIKRCQNEIDVIKKKSKQAANDWTKLKKRVQDAEELNVNTKKARVYMKKAVENLKQGSHYDDVIQFIKKGEIMLEKAEEKCFYNISKRLKKKIAYLEKVGVRTAPAEKLFKKAKRAMDDGKYLDALQLATNIERELDRVKEELDT